jgi:leucyl aminopeptidase (aminopeptidase T)
VYHALTAHLSDKSEDESESFISSRYNDQTFHGIFIDTGAARISTTGILQVRSLQRRIPNILINESTKEYHHIAFGAGDVTSIETITVPTPISDIRF